MKLSYYDLLGEYKELYDNQSESVKQALEESKVINDNTSIKEIVSFLSQQEVEYSTYSHS